MELPGRPALRRHLTPVRLEGQGVLLLGEDESHRLSGRVYEDLVPELSGLLTLEELVARL